MKIVDGIARRCRIDLWTPAEKAIFDAMQAVENMPAHEFLTDAVVLLQRARDRVADFVELELPKPFAERVEDAARRACAGWQKLLGSNNTNSLELHEAMAALSCLLNANVT